MNSISTNDQRVPLRGLRALAVLDAWVIPCLGFWWISTWSHTDRRGAAVIAALFVFWGARRTWRALNRFDRYRFIVARLARWGAWLVVAALAWSAMLWWFGA